MIADFGAAPKAVYDAMDEDVSDAGRPLARLVRSPCKWCQGTGETSFPEATSVDIDSDGYYPCAWCDGKGYKDSTG